MTDTAFTETFKETFAMKVRVTVSEAAMVDIAVVEMIMGEGQ